MEALFRTFACFGQALEAGVVVLPPRGDDDDDDAFFMARVGALKLFTFVDDPPPTSSPPPPAAPWDRTADRLSGLSAFLAGTGTDRLCSYVPNRKPRCFDCAGVDPPVGARTPWFELELPDGDSVQRAYERKYEKCGLPRSADDDGLLFECANEMAGGLGGAPLVIISVKPRGRFRASRVLRTNRGQMFKLCGATTGDRHHHRGAAAAAALPPLDVEREDDCRILYYEKIPDLHVDDIPGEVWVTTDAACLHQSIPPLAVLLLLLSSSPPPVQEKGDERVCWFVFIDAPRCGGVKLTIFELFPAIVDGYLKGLLGTCSPSLVLCLKGLLHRRGHGVDDAGDQVARELFARWGHLGGSGADPDKIFVSGAAAPLDRRCPRCDRAPPGFPYRYFSASTTPAPDEEEEDDDDLLLRRCLERSFSTRVLLAGPPPLVPVAAPPPAELEVRNRWVTSRVPGRATVEVEHLGGDRFAITRGGAARIDPLEWKEAVDHLALFYGVGVDGKTRRDGHRWGEPTRPFGGTCRCDSSPPGLGPPPPTGPSPRNFPPFLTSQQQKQPPPPQPPPHPFTL